MGLFRDQKHVSLVSTSRLVFLKKQQQVTQFNFCGSTFTLFISIYGMFYLKKMYFACDYAAALAVSSEAYFSAVAKMGDQALHTLSSRSLGKRVSV